jgi:Aerobic-type carbon monoxide dehydrogenase, large subunit CoxL/CutL homologs
MDYLKPTAADLPNIEGDRTGNSVAADVARDQGSGRRRRGGAPAAIASAVEDALAPLGIHIAALPIVPSRLWEVAAAGLTRYENGRK